MTYPKTETGKTAVLGIAEGIWFQYPVGRPSSGNEDFKRKHVEEFYRGFLHFYNENILRPGDTKHTIRFVWDPIGEGNFMVTAIISPAPVITDSGDEGGEGTVTPPQPPPPPPPTLS
jgi:hypothetical protein